MSRIKNFKCYDDLKKFIYNKTYHEIGSGGEGICYKGYDDKAYKLLYEEPIVNTPYKYDINKIITNDNINIESFIFPDELYVVNNELKGYKSKLIKCNLFSSYNTSDISTISFIDFNNLINAYNYMLNDIDILSTYNILANDLALNIIYDGDRLYAIDTCSYTIEDYYTANDNMHSFNSAFEFIFNMWFKNSDINSNFEIKDNDINKFLYDVKRKLPDDIKNRVNIKRK